MSKLTPEQYTFLTDQIQQGRVRQLRGNSHLEAWDVRRNLIRAFGFGGFDIETKSLDLVAQIEHPPTQQGSKPRWTVVYRAEVRLLIKATDGAVLAVYEDGASGDSQNQPSLGDAHDQAMKTALSQGLKRCAVNLGDQFGLSLYNGGGTNRVVVRTLVHPELPDAPDTPALPQDDAPVLPEPGTEPAEEHQEPEAASRPVSSPPAAEQTKQAPTATGIRDWTLRPDRTAGGIRQAAVKLRREHPAVAAERVTNEHGDDEQLSVLMDRRAKELEPQPQDPPKVDDRRRKRMFALLGELGYGDQEKYHAAIALVLKQEITSTKDMTPAQVEDVIAALDARKRKTAQQRTEVAA